MVSVEFDIAQKNIINVAFSAAEGIYHQSSPKLTITVIIPIFVCLSVNYLC